MRNHSRTTILAAAALIAASSNAHAQTPDVPLLVSTQWLADNIADRRTVVVAVGFQTRAAYDSAHIRGAQYLPYSAYAQKRDGLTTEIPPMAELNAALESIGISNDSRIVLYGSSVIVHRLFLALDVAGLRGQVGILDGGLDAWRRAQGALASGEPPVVRPGKLVLHPRSDILVDRAWVRDHLTDTQFQFVDARMPAGFARGHLEGAASVPAFMIDIVSPTHRASSSLATRDSLQRAFAAGGVLPSRQLVTYCAIGEVASIVYFAARTLGLPVKFYDGSLEDWQSAPAGALVRSP